MSTRCDEGQEGYDGLSGRPATVVTCHDNYNEWYPWLVYVTDSGKENFATWTNGEWVDQGEKPRCSRGVTTCNRYQITFDVNLENQNVMDDRHAVDDALLLQLQDASSDLRQASLTHDVDVSAGLNGWRACEEEPCQNGGTCTAIGQDSYLCECDTNLGFSGPDCGDEWNSTPDQINARFAYYIGVTGTQATLQWDQPGLGTWEWPVRGYRVRSNAVRGVHYCQDDDVCSNTVFCTSDTCACEEVDGEEWCELTGIYSPDVDSLDHALDETTDICEDESCAVLYGLSPGTTYNFQIIAYNLDGDSAKWSDSVYSLHTHEVPNQPLQPTYVDNDDTTVTLELAYPVTVGTNDCGSLFDADHSVHEVLAGYAIFLEDKDIDGQYCTTDGEGSPVTTYSMQYALCGDETCLDVEDEDYVDVITAEDGRTVIVDVVTVNESQEYTFDNLQPNKFYSFRYAATNAIGQSLFSPSVIVETYDVPETPTACDYVAITDSSITLLCMIPYNGGVNIDGVRLFGQSFDTDAGDWIPATRYTLTNNEENYNYESSRHMNGYDANMIGWLEFNTELAQMSDLVEDSTTIQIEVEKLSHDTDYRFSIVFQNRVGDSEPSVESVSMRTLETKITTVQAYVGAPCIYNDDRSTTFRAVSDGTNAQYKWELLDGSVIAEGDNNNNCENDSCSMMNYEFPNLGLNSFKLIAYNTRGMRSVEIHPEVEFCGCTDIYDKNYWEHATYHLPHECDSAETWVGGDHDLMPNEEMTYQTYYDENVLEMEVTVRVDVGAVDVYWSTWQVPDIDLRITYAGKETNQNNGISGSTVITIPYQDLYGSNTLYIKVVGRETSVTTQDGQTAALTVSRFELVAHQSSFTRGIDEVTRENLEDQEPVQITDLKTGYSDFYEYYFSKAESDVDVEITVTVQKGCVSVYTSMEERFPDARRSTGEDSFSADGYWYLYESNSTDVTNILDHVRRGCEGQDSLSIMHTIKPWEGYMGMESFRGLFVSVLGNSPYLLGDEQATNEYTITAKIYRYRIDSVLIDFNGDDVVIDENTGASTITEDYRYSVVTEDNFNYYELRLSDTGYAFTVDIELVFGEVDVYLSNSKLPTLDAHVDHDHHKDQEDQDYDVHPHELHPIGHDTRYVLSEGENTIDITYEEYNQLGNYIYLGVFGESHDASYRITITEESFSLGSEIIDAYDGVPVDADISSTDTFFQIYVGEPDEAMEVTSRSSPGSRTLDLGADPNTWGIDWTEPLSQTWIEQNMDEYDLDVQISLRFSPPTSDDGPCGCEDGSNFCNYNDGESGTCEPCSNHGSRDSCYNDNLPDDGAADCALRCFGILTYDVFASTYENFPSEERGYEVMASFNFTSGFTDGNGWQCSDWEDDNDADNEPECSTEDSSYVKECPTDENGEVVEDPNGVQCEVGGYEYENNDETYYYTAAFMNEVRNGCLSTCHTTLITIPHFTFSTRMVYFNVRSTSSVPHPLVFTIEVKEHLPMQPSQNAVAGAESAEDCPGEPDCSNHGNCVDGECLCDDQYLGNDCSIEAFSNSAGQPQVSLASESEIFDASAGGQYAMCYESVPTNSFVLMYLDGMPYPSKASNQIFLYSEECEQNSHSHDECSDCGIDIMIYGLTSVDVDHTLEVILLSADSQALDTAMATFQIDNNNDFCKDDCNDAGICHDGYCVCFDGRGGEACEYIDADENGLNDADNTPVLETPGQGYVEYISMQNDQTQKMAAYENAVALAKNEYIIARSNEELAIAAASVKETINEERVQLKAKMTNLTQDLEYDIQKLYLKREELEIAVQQMREESNRLQTKNEEQYIDFQRDMSEYMTDMQNRLDADLKVHAEVMAQKADNWAAVKEELTFELNQLKTANGPLVDIENLQTTQCTQDDFFQVSCETEDASELFEEGEGYVSHGTGEWIDGEYVIDGNMVDGVYNHIPR
jgi:hypothetical protein